MSSTRAPLTGNPLAVFTNARGLTDKEMQLWREMNLSLALRTVQDEVAKLQAANLIVSRSNGYQRFYRANSKHPLYRVLHELVRKGTAQAKPNPRQLPSRRRKALAHR